MKSIKAGASAENEEVDAYSVPTFCARHNISTGTYYNLRRRGLGPHESRVSDRRVIITKEAAAEWRRRLPVSVAEVPA
jgi:hypothetical protein